MTQTKTRIRVVDDDARLRDLLNRYLAEQGYTVRVVADAAEMNRQLARERYELMILDLMLPGEDGLSICRRLRGSGETMPIPVTATRRMLVLRRSRFVSGVKRPAR